MRNDINNIFKGFIEKSITFTLILLIWGIFLVIFPIFLNSIIESALRVYGEYFEIIYNNNQFFQLINILFPNFQITSFLVSGVMAGILLFLATSMFTVEVKISDGHPKFGNFNLNKVIKSFVYLPIFLGTISSAINIELTYNDFVLTEKFLSSLLYEIGFNLSLHWEYYFNTIFKMTPTALTTIYFIKLYIFNTFDYLLYAIAIYQIFKFVFIKLYQLLIEIYKLVKLYIDLK